ncbi:MAG: hypothetical protein KJ626_15735 [Verrucomicrobia bacterium]|nr:hypothetical protein [Verrucomicrobiota bacterium]
MIDSDNSIGAPVVEGVYSIYLSAGFAPDFSLPQVGISQTAEVPTGITYLAFTTRNVHTNLVIYTYLLGGVDLLQEPPTDIGGGLLRYSTDVSAFAGTTQTLQFAVQSRDSGAYGHVIDDIQFVIPEPQMLSLLIVGGSLIAYLRRRL